tara:strand:- start:1639 stop:2811 length:1173 start_codon:yes stop_codon:yes gene_type:complete
MNKNIVIFGLGYVGTSMAALLSSKNNVLAIDIDVEKVNQVNSKISPIKDEDISDYLANKDLNLLASCDTSSIPNNVDFFVVATPTSYDENTQEFDTSSVIDVITKIIELNKSASIVLKSTLPIGFTSNLKKAYPTLNFIFSPEFLREGKALYDNLYPSRIIISGDPSVGKIFADLLEESANKKNIPRLFMDFKEAEAVKLFSNSYLAMRVAYFNEIDTFAMSHNLSSKNIIEGVSLDNRIGQFYNNPSFGYGGYCLPKDTKQLLYNFKEIPENLISAIVDSNLTRKKFISDYILKLNPSLVGIYRLVMKSGSDNYRDAAIIDIIRMIDDAGIDIIIYEPEIKKSPFMNVKVIDDLDHFKKECDLIIANRLENELLDVSVKIMSRDIFNNN